MGFIQCLFSLSVYHIFFIDHWVTIVNQHLFHHGLVFLEATFSGVCSKIGRVCMPIKTCP